MNATLLPSMATCFVSFTLVLPPALAQGPLAPLGTPAPTMKTLEQVEPRTAISSLPFPISAPGSYYLTTNLTGVVASAGITINAGGVTLDLNGFELAGVPGSLDGIVVPAAQSNIAIHNGTIRDWGGSGVEGASATGGEYHHLRLSDNGAAGLSCGTNSVVAYCTATDNGENGIVVHEGTVTGCAANGNGHNGVNANKGSTVAACTTNGNGLSGVVASQGCTVRECTARSNGFNGIFAVSGCTVSGCTAQFNTANGIEASAGIIRECLALNNQGQGIRANTLSHVIGCNARSNADDGIFAFNNSLVSDCVASLNTGDGIEAASDCRVVNNACTGNGLTAGDGAAIHVTGTGNRIENNEATTSDRGLDIDGADNYVTGNRVQGNTDNYDIVAGNQLNILLCETPEFIDWPASVKLAGDLSSPTRGVTITADDVTLDLNGFTLTGTGSGTGDYGVLVDGSSSSPRRRVVVKNGAITRFYHGIFADHTNNCHYESLLSCTNRNFGIFLDGSSGECNGNTIRWCKVSNNAGRGIHLLATSSGECNDNTILECLVNNNGGVGLFLRGSSSGECNGNTVRECTVNNNMSDGIFLDGNLVGECNGNTIRACTANNNTSVGIKLLGIGGECDGNVVRGCTARGNTFGGISLHTCDANEVDENHVSGPGSFGIQSIGTNANLILRNTCVGQPSNFSLSSTDTSGPIVTTTGVLSTVGADAHPWANFSR